MAYTHLSNQDGQLPRGSIILTAIFLYPIAYCIYNVYFHPLSRFPGPLLWRAMRLPYMRAAWGGKFPYIVRDLHRAYGDVVRIAPDELSFAHSDAWDDIFSNRGDRSALPKSTTWHGTPKGATKSVFSMIDLKEHAQTRRAMDPAFSERAVAAQEPILQEYVNLLIQRLRERVSSSSTKNQESTIVNIIEWLNYVTFDIIGDLAFGESFHCLENIKYAEWMSFMFTSVKVNYLTISLKHYPLLFNQLMRLIPQKSKEERQAHWRRAADKVNRRLQSDTERSDITSFLYAKGESGQRGLTTAELHANAGLFTIAGSETTVTVLTGIVNYLMQDSVSLGKVEAEVRNKFTDSKDITLAALKHLPYLNATIHEGLRMCNPNPIGNMRITPPDGAIVAGYQVPGSTLLTNHPITLMFSDQHFYEASTWHPERWLEEAVSNPESLYYNDDRRCVRTFGYGPQSCIGEPLAWAEMRLVLAKLIWAFDMTRADNPHGRVIWDDQDVFGVIDKHPLEVTLAFRS